MSSEIQTIIELFQNSKNNSLYFVASSILVVLIIITLIKQIFNYLSLSEFDTLFLSKKESDSFKIIKNIIVYLIFSISFLFVSFLFTLSLSEFTNDKTMIFNIKIPKVLGISFSALFLTSIPLLTYNFSASFLNHDNQFRKFMEKYKNRLFIRTFLYLNISLAIIFETILLFLLLNYTSPFEVKIIIIFLPLLFIFFYSPFSNLKTMQNRYEIILINEEEFKSENLLVNYALDNDRMIFKSQDTSNKDIYMYDRSTDRFMLFKKIDS
ncbi:hypothetical protein CHH62_17045 [Niallia circulans]|jgi:hypothetical protein|uniref:hypothetical protein n=1 Tax=Niallia TaxID=2837506 RepID=UPI000BA58C42|nr:hypothetical protein [Niallia circulans]PAD24505.1 hypothetical protein CHH62_17045 [Niallia circulans]